MALNREKALKFLERTLTDTDLLIKCITAAYNIDCADCPILECNKNPFRCFDTVKNYLEDK